MPEIPKVPQNLSDRLRAYDKGLLVRMNTDEGLWEIVETLPTGRLSHCFFWHDGPWSSRQYKNLPDSAEPLLTKIAAVDWRRSGGNPMSRYNEFKARGAEKRARKLMEANDYAKGKLKEFTSYMQKNWVALARQHHMGGASRDRAIRARTDAVREILYDGKLPIEE